jgi:hypothetical protein
VPSFSSSTVNFLNPSVLIKPVLFQWINAFLHYKIDAIHDVFFEIAPENGRCQERNFEERCWNNSVFAGGILHLISLEAL